VRQIHWLYSDARYVKWTSLGASYDGIKSVNKTMKLAMRWRRHEP